MVINGGAAVQGLILSLFYLAFLGLLCFPLGRLLARLPLEAGRPPFAPRPWERSGRIYEKLSVRAWQKRVPDVSRMFPGAIPKKQAAGSSDPAALQVLLRETCVAELVHWLLCLAGLPLIGFWKGGWGLALYLIYVILGNLPFIIIQRYNRPRLLRICALRGRQERGRRENECFDPQLQ